MSSATRQQPKWHQPSLNDVARPTLKLQNSLTKTKTEFVPIRPGHISWYNCGPTVYDAAHMGHARTYLSMDIIRRVLESYFNYKVEFVQNITDIDDKIILRARQQFLFDELKKSTDKLDDSLIQLVDNAWKNYVSSKLSKVDGAVSDALKDWTIFEQSMTPEKMAQAILVDEKFKMNFSALQKSYAAIQKAKSQLQQGDASKDAAYELLEASQDIVAADLDKQKGAQVNDPAVFRDLPAYWEDMYFKDMEALNVKPPSVKTRVSEFVPEIIAYVEKIVANGYAYAAEGSVYFDTSRFDGHNGHHYAKLEPWSKGDAALIEDGEGSLGSKLQGKRNPNDFALWKASKPGEPTWDSPWGKGRPGWHIECSVMASAVLGDTIDIHSGGIDLAFPHHDNELAQAEAYYDCKQWINYFLHAGHLHVEGQKMSKSLKNFITIQEALKTYSARQLRLFFLLHQWSAKMDFKQSSMQEAIQIEGTIKNFFDYVKALGDRIRTDGSRGSNILPDGTLSHRWREAEAVLSQTFKSKIDATHAALCDSINTPVAMDEIMALISETNKYMAGGAGYVNIELLEDIAGWVAKMLQTFGVEIGTNIAASNADTDGFNKAIRQLSAFRDKVRQLALEKKDFKEYLKICDELRDAQLPELGVILDDQKDGVALVKIVSPEEAMKARDEKQAAQAEKLAKAREAKRQRLQKGYERLLKGVQSPEDLERERTQAEKGEMSKNALKKLKKDMDTQKALHDEYLKYASFLQRAGKQDDLDAYEAYLEFSKSSQK
ncbi:hypothetical protein VTP01DRAFT_8914 [Rhizomucor pusillus]|uniref:uncharacterized protein n=1 Tax=Rhizomucor pusillus TaxID=4840 RepID=UPI003742CA1F